MKKLLLFLFITIMSVPAFSAVTGVTPMKVGANGMYIEAATTNNPVMHFSIAADSSGDTLNYLSVENYLDSWYLGAADEPSSISPNTVKLWYMPADSQTFSTSTAAFISVLPSEFTHAGGANNYWYENLNLVVANGSGLWITIDTQAMPSTGSVEFTADSISFDSGALIDIYGKPSSPPVMLLTQSTPANNLEISKTGGSMQPYISTSQDTIIPFSISFYNNSGANSASCSLNSITLTVQSYSPLGVTLVPKELLSSIKVQDKNFGTIYGNVTRSEMPSAAAPIQIPISLLNIPANTTVTANVVISATTINAYAGTNFVITLNGADDLNAYDYYTLKKVPAKAAEFEVSGFPLYSNFTVLQKQASALNVSSSAGIMPSNINKGQKDVPLFKMYLTNPGDPLTASAEIYNLKFSVYDGSNLPVKPSDIFDRMIITDESGNITYGLKSGASIETSGNTINFPLLNTIGVVSGTSVTITVKADISQAALPNKFYISSASQSAILVRDINSFAAVDVTAFPSFPLNSGTATLSGSVSVEVPSVMPANLYAGGTGIKLMEIRLSAPVAFGTGNSLAARGITLTAKDISGAPVNMASVLSSLRVTVSSPVASSDLNYAVPVSDSLYADFGSSLSLTNTAETIITVYGNFSSSASGSVALYINSSSDMDIYQFNDPSRDIFIALKTGAFPVSSGTGVFSGDSGSLSLSTYPNPLRFGSNAAITYNLPSDSTVTIAIYDAMGTLVRKIITKEARSKGGHETEKWDGRNENGKPVNAGTYLIKIITEGSGTRSAITKKLTLIK